MCTRHIALLPLLAFVACANQPGPEVDASVLFDAGALDAADGFLEQDSTTDGDFVDQGIFLDVTQSDAVVTDVGWMTQPPTRT